MEEIYWITRLDTILVVSTIFAVITGLFSIIVSIFNYTDNDKIESRQRNILWGSWVIFIVTLLVSIFTPSTKDAYIIYGIGGSLDYLKSNDTVKKLPNKCIYALDKWVDEYVSDIDNKSKENAEN